MKHRLVLLIVLVVTAALHLSIQRAQAEAARKKPPQDVLNIPSTIGPYRQDGDDLPIEERTLEILQTSTILMRNYRSPQGWPVQLTLVYAGSSRRSMHFPEVCLVGDGYEIREQATEKIGFQFESKRLVLVKGNTTQAVLYWFKTGDKLTGNFFINSWYWAANQLTFGAPTSSMIKISAPVAPPLDEEGVFQILEDFADKFAPVLMERVN